jgi:quercetin dioxygenase-like cupin family protein
MVASLRSQPHGGRAFTRHTRPDPRRYGTPPRRCLTSSIRAFGRARDRYPCGAPAGAWRTRRYAMRGRSVTGDVLEPRVSIVVHAVRLPGVVQSEHFATDHHVHSRPGRQLAFDEVGQQFGCWPPLSTRCRNPGAADDVNALRHGAVRVLLIDSIRNPDEQSCVGCAHVRFTPGARTAWHTHPRGQTLYATDGIGYVGRRSAEVQEIRPGDVVYIEPNEEHWHGATPDRFMAHIAIQEADDNGRMVTWGDHVTDRECASLKAEWIVCQRKKTTADAHPPPPEFRWLQPQLHADMGGCHRRQTRRSVAVFCARDSKQGRRHAHS